MAKPKKRKVKISKSIKGGSKRGIRHAPKAQKKKSFDLKSFWKSSGKSKEKVVLKEDILNDKLKGKKLPVKKQEVKAFSAPKKKKGWFAERSEHSLAAKGIEIRAKEHKVYKVIYFSFIVIGWILGALALIKSDFLSLGIAVFIMFFSLLCYRGAVSPDKRRMIVYIMSWPLVLALAVASIWKSNFFSFWLAVFAMFISSFTPALIKKKLRKEEIIKQVRELQKSRKETETDFDKLLVLLQNLGKINLSEIAEAFSIDRHQAEEWVKILEENDLGVLHYPTFGEAELRKK